MTAGATQDRRDQGDENRYWVSVYGPDGTIVGEAEIFCADLREAVLHAAAIPTPFGHGLRSERSFLGRFELALSATDRA